MIKIFFCFLAMGFFLGCQEKASDNQGAASPEEPMEAVPSDDELLTSDSREKANAKESMEAVSLDDELLSVEDYIAKHYPPPNWGILKVIPSNLLSDIEEESLVFLEDPIRNKRSRELNQPYSDEPWPPSIHKIVCVYVVDGRTQEYELKGWSLGYKKRDLRVIKSYESLYGPWLDYCYLSDVDGDGIQETIFFILTGINFRMVTYKFQDGKFKRINVEDITAILIAQ